MKKIQKIIAGAVMTAMLMAPAGTVLADETEDTCGGADAGTETITETTQEQTFETIYGSQIGNYLDHQYTFEGEAIPVSESNFYFINAFLELSQYAYYGQAPSTSEGYVDLSAEFGTDYPTYGDYLVAYAENTIESTMIVCKMANDAGVTISDDYAQAIDDMVESLAVDYAAPQGITLDEYLALYFGDSMTEAAFRATLEDYYLADTFSEEYCKTYEFTDEEMYVPNIRYALFYAPAGSSEDSLSQAEAAANDLLSQCADINDLQTKAQELNTAGTVMETNDILVPKGQMVPSFEEWAYEPHGVGDMDVIKSDEYGYFVVGYLGLAQRNQDDLDAIALTALSNEISDAIDAGIYQFGTDQPYDPAMPVDSGIVFDSEGNGEISLNITTTPTPAEQAAPAAADSSNPILIVLAIVGGVAIVGVIVVLVVNIAGGNKNGGNGADEPSKPAKKAEPEPEEEPETDDEE